MLKNQNIKEDNQKSIRKYFSKKNFKSIKPEGRKIYEFNNIKIKGFSSEDTREINTKYGRGMEEVKMGLDQDSLQRPHYIIFIFELCECITHLKF